MKVNNDKDVIWMMALLSGERQPLYISFKASADGQNALMWMSLFHDSGRAKFSRIDEVRVVLNQHPDDNGDGFVVTIEKSVWSDPMFDRDVLPGIDYISCAHTMKGSSPLHDLQYKPVSVFDIGAIDMLARHTTNMKALAIEKKVLSTHLNKWLYDHGVKVEVSGVYHTGFSQVCFTLINTTGKKIFSMTLDGWSGNLFHESKNLGYVSEYSDVTWHLLKKLKEHYSSSKGSAVHAAQTS